MGSAKVVLLSTLATKGEETAYLIEQLDGHDVDCVVIDLSLDCGGAVLDGPGKIAAMELASDMGLKQVIDLLLEGASAVIGLGGGTGGEIMLRLMKALPITFPKALITTLPFDPRSAVADTSIILIPTLVDICGLNATLREVLRNAAAMIAGLSLAKSSLDEDTYQPSIAVTALGATEGAIAPLLSGLRDQGHESTVFHANGFGGAAFARFAANNAFHALIDLTPHELTRIHIAGAHVPMPNRFSIMPNLPRVVLPGGLNFLGLGEKSLIPQEYLDRPHYAHSGYFTHAKVTSEEMITVTDALTDSLNASTGPTALIVPMGGFSHQDRAGGAIEDKDLRQLFLDRARARLGPEITVTSIDAHIADAEITAAILDATTRFLHA
jgi:uncharacterized protein (UPF0261 family)